MTQCERFRVSGRVQGVGFRAATLDKARQLGLRGWVRNLPDGRVEVLAQGAAPDLEQLADWLRQGPRYAVVTQLERETSAFHEQAPDFHIR